VRRLDEFVTVCPDQVESSDCDSLELVSEKRSGVQTVLIQKGNTGWVKVPVDTSQLGLIEIAYLVLADQTGRL
jgi:hypothetical protein